MEIIQTLVNEGLIRDPEQAEAVEVHTEMAAQTAEQTETADESIEPVENTEPEAAEQETVDDGNVEETAEEHDYPEAAEVEAEPTEEADLQSSGEDSRQAYPLDLVIDIPFKNHTGQTLRNLLNLVYSRGALISKATGGCFLILKCDTITAT